jgi:hypothetical protein
MHIPPEDLRKNVSKLIDRSSKYVVNVDWKETDATKSSFYNFAHDYASLYRTFGLSVQQTDLDELAPQLAEKINQTIYLASKNASNDSVTASQ